MMLICYTLAASYPWSDLGRGEVAYIRYSSAGPLHSKKRRVIICRLTGSSNDEILMFVQPYVTCSGGEYMYRDETAVLFIYDGE